LLTRIPGGGIRRSPGHVSPSRHRTGSGSERIVIQRLISTIVGAVVTFLLLLLFHNGRLISNETTGFLVAVVIGALISLLWPLIWGTYMGRRARDAQQATFRTQVQREVEAQRVADAQATPEEQQPPYQP
jgi:uncharacterized membrane protein YeaQ/YmgE (transglycosylase-associated protein family)